MIVLVMGVSGSGKSTIGQQLAAALNWQFEDADDFHPQANIEKMSRGIPLEDSDRIPWLQTLSALIDHWLKADKNAVLACSALKSTYRQFLWQAPAQMQLVYLKGSFQLLQARLQQRQHFMTAALLQSQLDTLEEPEDGIQIDISAPPDLIVQQIREQLGI
ncbi:MAG: gluconokinase [Cyanothece sp. SIO1E1]|nr:gluconokinase [Cyanothece sp. SIO1E1]